MSSSSPTPVQYNGLNPADYKPGTVAPCEVCGRNCFRSPNSKEGFRCKDHTFAAMKLAELEEQPEPKPKKHKTKKEKSLTIKIQEMEKYDWNPSMRLLLFVIHLGTRRAKDNYDDTWAPTGWTAEEMVGWCDMAQWRLAQRVGLTEDRINEMLQQLEDDGFIDKEGWTDPDTNMLHCRYRIIVETVDANQRPSHTPKTKRGDRYAKGSRPSKANGNLHKGMFSKSNQPGVSAKRKAIMEEDDE
jgi:hypothetical protein